MSPDLSQMAVSLEEKRQLEADNRELCAEVERLTAALDRAADALGHSGHCPEDATVDHVAWVCPTDGFGDARHCVPCWLSCLLTKEER